ncbi:MAG: MFS transporter [Spirochaetales bacterium]|nr:MFS transporter [Spirochaetales bacterium]
MVASWLLVAVVYAAFISLGLPDGATGVAWPAMRATLAQPLEALGLVSLVGTIGSALSGFASGRVLARLGTPKVVLISGLLTGSALLGFGLAPGYLFVVLLALPLGFGAGSVDAGLNHYAAERWSSRRMNWLHASWGIGATLGPLAMTAAIAAGSGGQGWRAGYLAIGAAQLALAFVFLLTLGLWDKAPPVSRAGEGGGAPGAPRKLVPGTRGARLAGILAPATYALYAGCEVGLGSWAASVMRDGRGFDATVAGSIVALYFGSITAGRVVSGLVADRIGNRRMVRLGLATAAVGVALFSLPLGPIAAAAGLALAGFGYAPVYPCLMHETPRRFDPETTRKVVGRQVASAYLGGMVLPPALGLAAGWLGAGAVGPGVLAYIALMSVAVLALDRLT